MVDEKQRNAQVLGLARRAGALETGTDAVVDAVRHGKAKLVLLTSDCSDATAKKLTDKTSFYNVPLIKCPLAMEELSHAVGVKRLTAAAAITDANFVKLYMKGS
ncbi:50S ribosomal protein L7ae [Clostridia bacterium]|nr:50S ribosomal protein L7ae [Clostridia bacterium]